MTFFVKEKNALQGFNCFYIAVMPLPGGARPSGTRKRDAQPPLARSGGWASAAKLNPHRPGLARRAAIREGDDKRENGVAGTRRRDEG
jgi:hypothetical protein